MEATRYNRNNFHKHTFCIFRQEGTEAIEGLQPGYKSKSGSCYYFTDKGVYRLSNHWGRAANCRWRLDADSTPAIGRLKLGYANWEDFHPDNETEKLYFIRADFDQKSVQFYHKGSNPPSDAVLRTASETMKRIKQIRVLLTETAWAKYLKVDDIAALRESIIRQLITTDASLQEIRKLFL